MAQTSFSTASIPQVAGAHVAVIISKWYREYTESMAKKCGEILDAAGCGTVETHVVPGCLEIPLAARRLAKRFPNLEAIVVFGVILKGDTYHFEMVKDLCMSGLEKVMFECDIPVINEVLPVDKIEYAAERSADNEKNKGIEAGLAAAEIIAWRRNNPL